MNLIKVEKHIIRWLIDYISQSELKGFVVGVSGGIDSAVTSTLCAKTGFPTLLINMPIHQKSNQFDRSNEHIEWLKEKYNNVSGITTDLTNIFETFSTTLPAKVQDELSMANLRSRLRMSNLYVFASNYKYLVVGTGNKVEDFGVGFYTKYGDGGVDISPIADLLKSEVFALAKHINIVSSIQSASPTDGLWDDDRNDEDQLGASYADLEWAMNYTNEKSNSPISERKKKILNIFNQHHKANLHKMVPIPVCNIPEELKK